MAGLCQHRTDAGEWIQLSESFRESSLAQAIEQVNGVSLLLRNLRLHQRTQQEVGSHLHHVGGMIVRQIGMSELRIARSHICAKNGSFTTWASGQWVGASQIARLTAAGGIPMFGCEPKGMGSPKTARKG